jgi:hypothetical protein
MTEFALRAGLFVFAVIAALTALWLGGALIGSLIILAFIAAFAGSRLPALISSLEKISRGQ